MAAHSLPDNQTRTISLDKVVRTASANGTWIDTGRDAHERMFELDVGLWVDGVHTFSFEHSVDASTAVALTRAQLDDPAGLLTASGTIVIDAADEDNLIIQLGILGTHRYVRPVQTVTGSPSTGLISGVSVVESELRAAGGVGQPMSATGYQRIQPVI